MQCFLLHPGFTGYHRDEFFAKTSTLSGESRVKLQIHYKTSWIGRGNFFLNSYNFFCNFLFCVYRQGGFVLQEQRGAGPVVAASPGRIRGGC